MRFFVAAIIMLLASVKFATAAPHLFVDVRSGKVLSQEQAFDRWYPASLTKLMTAYTVFHALKQGKITKLSPVVVSQQALNQPPSKMGYPVGSVLNIDTAVKILMVKSANDIAVAVAEAVGGSEPAFVAAMNAHAQRLGLRDTHFTNPHGLHDPQQYTSARDMAVLALALKKEFPQHVGYFTIPAIKSDKKILPNHNPFLSRYDGATGMKTGFVCASGLNIVVTVKRYGRETLGVVLGGPTGQERNVRAARLFDETFKKAPLFMTAKLDSLSRPASAKTQPIDMRPVVCKNSKERKAERATDQWKQWKAALDEEEEELLGPKQRTSRYIPVVLGNATGPDPYGLLKAKAASGSNLTAFALDSSSSEWPTVFGSKRVKVPVPARRPNR